jgi:integrase
LEEAAERICAGDGEMVAQLERKDDALRQLLALIENRSPQTRPAELIPQIQAVADAVSAPSERSVRRHAQTWIALQQTMASAGQLTPARVNNVRMALAHFTHFVGETASVESINAAKLQGFYTHALNMIAARREDKKAGWSVPFAKETFAIAKAFIRWLIEQGTIPPPTNITARFRFGSTVKNIETWTPEEVRHVISEAPGKLKLALLLMCNCGMTQQDVSDLADDEVIWAGARIRRKRSKTANCENVPMVEYLLWPQTLALLKKYRSGTERVLLTESGKPYVRNEMIGGKLVKADGFTSNYKHLQRRLDFHKPMKLLRKTGATLLESHEVYGRFTGYFLGHSPRSMKDRSYAAPSQTLFDEAVLWLGQQLRQC